MIKPFKLDHLKKVSRHEIELLEALYHLFPSSEGREKLPLHIRKTLMKHLGQDIRYYLSSVDQRGFGEIVSLLPAIPVVAVLGLAPVDAKVLVQLDGSMASLAINRLLGGAGSHQERLKPLTETEQGVLQYLILQILAPLHSLSGVPFRFEKFLFDPREIARASPARERAFVMTVDVTLSEQSGFVRLIFPASFMKYAFEKKGGSPRPRESRALGRELARWGFVRTVAWAEGGRASISSHEMSDLETGDVVLFDECDLKLAGREIQGRVRLHFGPVETAVDASIVHTHPETIGCKLDRLTKVTSIF